MSGASPTAPLGPRYAQVIVDVAPAHLDRPFDYRVPEGQTVGVGRRVRVTFSGRRRTGWVVGVGDQTEADRVRDLDAVVGDAAWFDADDLTLYRWVADRYAGTLADVLRHAMPARVAAVEAEAAEWPSQPAVVANRPSGLSPSWDRYGASAMLEAVARPVRAANPQAFAWRILPGDDREAMAGELVGRCLAAGRSAVVIAPDPASPLPDAALALAGSAGADWRTTDARGRYRAFLRGRMGQVHVAVGERSAAFAPVHDLGLVIVDDESNPAYKERRSPRHHAREVALARARLAGATCVLLTDLPSAALVRLLDAGHVSMVTADRGSERERSPHVDIVDLEDPRPGTRRTRFSDRAARAIADSVRSGGAAVVLAARGGQGGAIACQACRRRLSCPTCDGALRTPRSTGGGATPTGWLCATCGWEGPTFACPDCGGTRSVPLAAGAGRLAQELARSHSSAEVVRMEGFDAPGPRTRPAIGVMTRGSVVSRPAWLGDRPADVVVLPDADAMAGRASLDAAEDALRLWLATGRWARRIIVQTREPTAPAIQALVRWDPDGFWHAEGERRRELRYPPHTSLVRLSVTPTDAVALADELRTALSAVDEVLGPDLDGALLVKSPRLRGTLDTLKPLRHAWAKAGRRVRIDVDPLM